MIKFRPKNSSSEFIAEKEKHDAMDKDNSEITVIDASTFDSETISNLMQQAWLCECAPEKSAKSHYYCGICADVKQNVYRHKVQHSEGFIRYYKCSDRQIAGEVEQLLKAQGFDAGDTDAFANGSTEDSIYVYMIEKVDGFEK